MKFEKTYTGSILTERFASLELNYRRVRISRQLSQFFLRHPFKSSGTFKKIFSRLLIPAPQGSCVVQTIFGFDIIVDPLIDKVLEKSIYYYGIYEAGTLSIMGHCLRSGDTFIDVGSNIGLMSLYASTLVGKSGQAISFEPDPEVNSILLNNIELNRAENIHVYDIAIGSCTNSAMIYRAEPANRGSSSLVKLFKGSIEGVEVNIETLDNFVKKLNVLRIRMLKIDVEGWELDVLRGASVLLSKTDAPIICIEYSNLHPIQSRELLGIYEYITNINTYKVFKLRKGKETISKLIEIKSIENLPYHDNLFCFLPFHLEELDDSLFS